MNVRYLGFGRLRIARQFFLYVLLAFPFFEIEGLGKFLPVRWEVIVFIDCIVIFILFVLNIKKTDRNTLAAFISFLLFFGGIFISTVINDGDLFAAVYYLVRMLCFIAIMDIARKNGQLRLMLSIMQSMLGIYILCTVAFQLFNPAFFDIRQQQSNHTNFLISDNFIGYYYISFILLSYLKYEKYPQRIRTKKLIFWSAICFISLILAWSATCMVMFILFLFLVTIHEFKLLRLLTPFRIALLSGAFSLLVIVFQFQDLFEWLIVGVLHKSMDLSGRVSIWAATISNIAKKPIWGYGTVEGGRMHINHWRSQYVFSHNMFLELLIQGGIVAIITNLMMYFMASIKMNHTVRKEGISSETDLINIAMLCMLFMQFSEFNYYAPISQIPLILCFFSQALQNEKTVLFHQQPKTCGIERRIA